MLPTFIVIGAMKCGTNSLHRYLSLHPEIGMSSTKEPNYFVREKNYAQGLDWYQSLFQGSAKAYGECSTNYTKRPFFEGVAQRMKTLLPDLKLIYLLRDPIERIVSHYIHNYAEGSNNRSFYDSLENLESNKYILTSSYYFQLQDYLNYYSCDQILIVCSEKLKSDPFSVLRTIFQFLEVDATFTDDLFLKKFHQSSEKQRLSPLDQQVSNKLLKGMINPFLPHSLKQKTAIERPVLDPRTKERLVECLAPDIEKLRSLSGQTFSSWSL